MTNQLHRVLKSLCFSSDWDCALFWKLQHGSNMLLTCEDAYYEDQERYQQPDNMGLDNNNRSSLLDHHSHGPLGSAVAMMSTHIHRLGHGVIGEVAVTGKHIWAFADKYLTDCCFPFETLVAVPVVPYGVVQLGSLSKVPENFTTVNYVRDAFATILDSSMGSYPRKKCSSDESSSMDLSTSMVDENNKPLQFSSDISILEQHILNRSVPISMDDQIGFCETELFGIQIQDLQMGAHEIGTLHKPFRFSSGCELYDVLGLPFGEESRCHDWKADNSETPIQMEEVMENSCLSVLGSGSEDLLEAVVANVSHVRSKKSFSGSQTSLITTEHVSQPSCENHDVGSFDQSVVQKERWNCLSSEEWCSSRAQSEQEAEMVTRKRARTGENRKPRPRDRQLIQDRIKELRKIVPSGSKCSIDSLLERTVKHMVYMQNLTKSADNLENVTQSKIAKLHNEETLTPGLSSCSQGSTWAVEVRTDLKACPLMIESTNMNGQMMIQIACDDCGHFLEVAETVRSLGLTILKSFTRTETHGKKTSMLFVVEGQNNQNLQRIDVFWQLMQILQSKSII